jgi:hypothetical protein
MKKIIFPAAVVFAFALFSSCNHEDAVIAAGKGDGGKATVNVFPQHHGVAANLINFKVYVKYNAADAPSNGAYDDSVDCANYDSLVSCAFTALRNGNYYFYGRGYDTSISQNVKGGLPYRITAQQTQSFNLPVSE